jgi:uncharacterized protein YabN with tetrapyrrole methylase and pyrophosphatase domain
MTTTKGRLVVVGTGIQTIGHLSNEARAWISAADIVFHLVPDPLGEALIERLNPRQFGLRDCYVEGRPRRDTYDEMVQRIVDEVRGGHTVCAAFYGHPGVFAVVPIEAIECARSEGFDAVMLPGISAEDCLFADLCVDPAAAGCLTYEATDFLINRRVIDPTAAMVIWQIGKLAIYHHDVAATSSPEALAALVSKLTFAYPPDHEVVLYEAATEPFRAASITRVTLAELPHTPTRAGHTMYVPPAHPVAHDPAFAHFRR